MNRILLATAAGALALTLSACELAPKVSSQNGYRGTGMSTVALADRGLDQEVPAPPYDPPPVEGPLASEIYENVQVLGNVSQEQFNYTMAALTAWVSPEQGCNYCHNPADMASDEVYTKVVARRMLEMNRAINANWDNHVGQTGVTCWTCHRGQNIPNEYWTLPEDHPGGIVGNRNGQNEPTPANGYSSLPNTAIAMYLLGDGEPGDGVSQAIRVTGPAMHPTAGHRVSTMEAENSYAIMMHLSQGLGVNCTFCHNSNSFRSWTNSNPARETAFHGIRMVRDINSQYITPLASVFPEHRLGAMGDPFKTNCTTCHQGQNLPMGGAPMARDYPALWPQFDLGPAAAVPAAPAAPSAPDAAAPAPAPVATTASAAARARTLAAR